MAPRGRLRPKNRIWLVAGALVPLAISGGLGANFVTPPFSPKSSPAWKAHLLATPEAPAKAWVFFTDKGFTDEATFRAKKESFIKRLDPHALKRRLKVRSRESAVSFLDLPVEPKYVSQLEARGAKILAQTEWLNGVCLEAPGRSIVEMEPLPFVREVRPERVNIRKNEPVVQRTWERSGVQSPEALDYGPSDLQLRQVNVTGLQSLGYSGAGVRVAIFDTGFDHDWIDSTGYRISGHESLKRTRIFKEWDFIYNKENTAYDPEYDTTYGETPPYSRIQTQHGTAMLSILGGYLYGRLIGSAFGADFLLAKTEHNKRDKEPDAKVEEYNWVRAMRWADTLGADIVSSSLGYSIFPGDTGQQYDSTMMDGKTAVTSKIASIAADSFGILVVNAIGNARVPAPGDTSRWLLAPSDADHIITVGGADTSGRWWSGACVGPTADGRRKPEVAALAYGTYMARNLPTLPPPSLGPLDSLEYRSGTSGATAVVAGLAALLLEAHTDSLDPSRSWGPLQVREALIQTASQANNPDYKLGWGIPDGVKALNYSPPVRPPMEDKDALLEPYPNPYQPAKGDGKLRLPFYLTKGGDVWIYIYAADGELVRKLPAGTNLLPGRYDRGGMVQMWDGKNEDGKLVASGTYLCLLKSGFGHDVKKVLLVR